MSRRGTAPPPRVQAAGVASRRAPLLRGLAYLWAGPTSLIGLAVALLTVLSGGRVARSHGVLEVWGGFAWLLLRCTPIGARALTLGHVVLGRNRASLDRSRAHELAHVRQAERWGPLFLPAYVAASLWAFLRGRRYYRDNWFEQDARRQQTRGAPPVAHGHTWRRRPEGPLGDPPDGVRRSRRSAPINAEERRPGSTGPGD